MSNFDAYENNADNETAHEFNVAQTHSATRYDPTNNRKLKTKAVFTLLERPQFNPGGANIFSIQNYGTPPFLPIGASILVRNMPRVFEGAIQASVQGDVNVTAGGFIPGQIVGQPLYDPQSNTIGGLDFE